MGIFGGYDFDHDGRSTPDENMLGFLLESDALNPDRFAKMMAIMTGHDPAPKHEDTAEHDEEDVSSPLADTDEDGNEERDHHLDELRDKLFALELEEPDDDLSEEHDSWEEQREELQAQIDALEAD
jgi:hypothetical protein